MQPHTKRILQVVQTVCDRFLTSVTHVRKKHKVLFQKLVQKSEKRKVDEARKKIEQKF